MGDPPSRGQKKKKKKNTFTHNLTTPDAGVRFLEVVVALVIKDFEHGFPKLRSRERRKINSRTRRYLFMKASSVVLRGIRLREEPLT